MCDEAVDYSLAALKFVPNWFVTSKNLLTALYADDNILYINENSGESVFSCNKMGILSIYLNNINLDDTNYYEDNPEFIIHIKLLAWHIKFEKLRTLNKELMLIALHLARWWNFCMSQDEKKKKELKPILTQ